MDKEHKDIEKKVAHKFIAIMVVLTTISFIPSFVLLNKIPEEYFILIFFSSLALTCVGVYITPHIYKKFFRND